MYQLEDGNTSALNEYLYNQDQLEFRDYLNRSLKQEAVIEYSKKIMEGLVAEEEFAWVFSEYYEDSDFDGDIYVDGFSEALDNWCLGNPPQDEIEYEMLWKIVQSSLEGASQILYDVEWEELFDNLGKTIKGVIAND